MTQEEIYECSESVLVNADEFERVLCDAAKWRAFVRVLHFIAAVAPFAAFAAFYTTAQHSVENGNAPLRQGENAPVVQE